LYLFKLPRTLALKALSSSSTQPAGALEPASLSGELATFQTRDFYTDVRTSSGAISGDFIIGKKATFRSNSGAMSLDVLPIDGSREAEFATQTMSGSTDIAVLSPLRLSRHPASSEHDTVNNRDKYPDRTIPIDASDHDPYLLTPTDAGTDDPYLGTPPIHPSSTTATTTSTTLALALRTLSSSHDSKSGAFRIHYPAEWEGEIKAESVSGHMTVSGPGVRVISSDRKDWIYKLLVARKGPDAEHASSTHIKGISGPVAVRVGSDCAEGGGDGDGCVARDR
jgi:hypothetical protein